MAPTTTKPEPDTSAGAGQSLLANPVVRKRLIWGALILALGVGLALWTGGYAVTERVLEDGTVQRIGADGSVLEHFGFASLLPALMTLVLVFITRNVVSSLFIGIAVGGLVSGKFNIVAAYLIPSIGSASFALILLVYLWALGGLIGLWTRTGGAKHFAEWAGERIVRGPRSAKFFGWLLGVVFHQGGTISTVLAGTTLRPIADRERVAHEETAYIVDSTASPVATLIPLNAWPLYVAGLVVGTIPILATEQDAVTFFFRTIHLNFYAIFAVLVTFLFAWELLPWEGKRMKAARLRARETGNLDAEGAQPLAADELTQLQVSKGYQTGLADFLVPLGVLIGVALVGNSWKVFTAPEQAKGVLIGLLRWDFSLISVPIGEAFGLAVLSAIVLALIKGMSVNEALDGFVDGAKGVTIGAIILALAVTLGNVSGDLGTADYIVQTTAGAIGDASFLLPAMFLLICMGIAFAIGSSWGTYAVVFPLAMPLAWAVNPSEYFIMLCFGAVMGGAVFGDQCSPISDTTILSSLATGADVMDHVYTQLPLALTAAGLGGILYTLLALFA